MTVRRFQIAIILFLYINSSQSITQKGCTVKHAYYNLVCSRFEFWCTTKYNFLTYEAICKNVTLTAKSLLTLDNKEKIYDIEIYSSDVTSLTAAMFIDYPNIARLYIQTSNTKEIQASAFKGLDKLDWLILKNNNISVIQPKSFSGLGKLNVLNLNLNSLTELRDSTFEGLDSLQFLSLKQNKISSIQDNTFAKLEKLGVIFLNDNLLTVISEKLFASNSVLRFAWFPNNSISSFPENFFDNKKLLGEIVLTNNQIISINYQGFNGNISLSKNKLQKLLPFGRLITDLVDLSFNNISLVPSGIFESSSHISTLLLNNNNIYSINQDAFRNLTKLRTLRLDFNKISELPLGMFQDLKVLNLLNISYNKIQHIASGVFTGLSYLDTLDLSNNRLYALQISALYPLKQLKTFYLNDNSFKYIDIDNLILHLSNLRLVNLDDNIWTCDWLSLNLVKFDIKGIKTIHGSTLKSSNVHGISCNNSNFSIAKFNSPPEPNDEEVQKVTVFENPVKASQSISEKSDSGPGAVVYIFATFGVLALVCAALYVVGKYYLKKKVILRRAGSNETVSYKLDLVDE